MFEASGNTSFINNQNFQMKLKKFKKNWLANWHRKTSHQNQITFKETPHENKTQATERSSVKSNVKRVRRNTTMNQSITIKKKDPLSHCPVGKSEKAYGQYSMITDKLKVSKSGMNLDTSKEVPHSQSNSQKTSKQKKKYRRKRSEFREKSQTFRNDKDYDYSLSTESTNIEISKTNGLRNYTTLNHNNSIDKNENTSNENLPQLSSFRLRSPILFRNVNEPETTSKSAQSPVTITTDIETGRSGFASSDGSFSFRKLEWGSHSVGNQKFQIRRPISDSWRNDDLLTSYNPMNDHRSKNQNNVLAWLRSLERPDGDIGKFSDDNENLLTTFALKYNKSVVANALVEKNYTRNIEMEMNGSSTFGMELHTFTDSNSHNKDGHSNFLSDCSGKVQNLFPSLNHEKRLFSRKKPKHWYDMPDSLESSLSTSKEKLNEIRGLF